MATRPLDPALIRDAVEAVRQHGSVSKAAALMGLSRTTLQHRVSLASATPGVQPSVAADRERSKNAADMASLKTKYNEALQTIERLEREVGATSALRDVSPFTIEPRKGSGTSEGTVVVLASDWHVEERVGAEIGGLNEYSLEIATNRATQFWQGVLRLTRLLQQDIAITEILVGLLGDFITGQIHEAENAETNQLTPNLAIVFAQDLIISGIQFLLDHTKCRLTFVCHSGNHARTTKRTRFGTENGHSLEYLMYLHLAAYFRGEKRVRFQIPEGMHSYVPVYDQTIRFQHGHAIKYGGGVGGIFIPANKAVAMWDRAKRADLSVFGHFHQLVDGGSFICNGSLIGYNSFALSIKASFEPPRQTLFLMDKRRGRTCMWPILFSAEGKAKALAA